MGPEPGHTSPGPCALPPVRGWTKIVLVFTVSLPLCMLCNWLYLSLLRGFVIKQWLGSFHSTDSVDFLNCSLCCVAFKMSQVNEELSSGQVGPKKMYLAKAWFPPGGSTRWSYPFLHGPVLFQKEAPLQDIDRCLMFTH